MATATRHLMVREVTQAVQGVEPSVLFVSSRILHRVIRFDRRLPTFVYHIPHRKSYFLARTRLFDVVGRFELEMDIDRTLPDTVILLERPDEEELLTRPAPEVLLDYWRLLFHVRVHLALEQRIADGMLNDTAILERLRRIGSAEFAEIRSVLLRDEMVLPPRTDQAMYVEFAAVFLELWYFHPEQLTWTFPALHDVAAIAAMLNEDFDHVALWEATRVPGAAEPADVRNRDDAWSGSHQPQAEVVELDPLQPSPPSYWRLLARAERVGPLGNVVKAAILRKKAARQALPDRRSEAESLAHAELERLARRLRPVLGLTQEETQDWAHALAPLLNLADRGLRTIEARLLYDLQKVCVEHERGVYALDLIGWATSSITALTRAGWKYVVPASWTSEPAPRRTPIRRPLPLLRQVLVTKHLQSAARKLNASRLSGEARVRLSLLIQAAAERSKQRLRDRVRPQIVESLESVGLKPRTSLDRVAFRKIVEVLLDRIVERGYLNMGHLRDTLSQNNLKLPDLTSLWELLFGDLLLRVDKRLSSELDGIYHRGPIYLRMSQRLSAMAFGTRLGRVLTRYLAIPFGGSYLILESLRHIYHLFVDHETPAAPELEIGEQLPSLVETAPKPWEVNPWMLASWLLLGMFLLLLIKYPTFRGGMVRLLGQVGSFLRQVFVEFPASILRWPWIRKLLDTPFYGVAVNYVTKPLVLTALVLVPYEIRFGTVSWRNSAITFLVINLLLNSPLGRYADMLVTEQLVRGWRELQMRVFAASFRMIIDLFQWLLRAMEQVVYTVDEWLRFRTGERGWVLIIKALLAVVWSVIAYVVRIYITLLIEPQVNPIKHFPVVTVSHKIMLPFSIHLTRLLATPLMPLGAFWANTIAGTTVFLLPGVFGFLVWELKENWRLYASNRPKNLRPIPIGSHSESMARLLRLGFHSGTVPRSFERLRHALDKAQRTGNSRPVHKQRAALHHVEEDVRRFVERELLALLSESPAWRGVDLHVREVRVACHEIRVEIWHGDAAYEPLCIVFQERSGWLIATLIQKGWLYTQDATRQSTFLTALRGLYKYAGVDLVWEQLVDQLRKPWWWYDVTTEGLLVWPDRNDKSTVLYQLRSAGAHASVTPPPRETIDLRQDDMPDLVFGKVPLSWQTWRDAWEPPPETRTAPPLNSSVPPPSAAGR